MNRKLWVQVPPVLMNKYERTLAALDAGKDAEMSVFGNSMMPLIKTKSVVTYRRTGDYQIGDVVLVRLGGNYLTHKITKIDGERYLISNNKGHDNGWVRKILGRVIAVNGEPFGRAAKQHMEGETDERAVEPC